MTTRLALFIGLSGCDRVDEIEFDREKWESMSDGEREAEVREHVMQYIDWSFEVKD